MAHWTPAGARGLDHRAVLEAVDRLALAWRSMGLERGDRVAILSENRPEWLLTDYALLGVGGVPVPIYTSLTPPQIEYILANSGAVGAVVSTPALLARLLEVRPKLPALRHVVLMDAASQEDPSITPWAALMQRGSELRLRDPDAFSRLTRAAEPGDLATIIYTSGTTGEPKGVMLTHANFVTNVQALNEIFRWTESDRALSFLPLSHVFQRMADFKFMMAGVSIIHVAIEDVAAALPAIRPTVLVSVPRLYEKMKERIEDKAAAAPPWRRRLFHWARGVGRRALLDPLLGGPPPSPAERLRLVVADRLVLSKVRAALGGRVRRTISGGAALPRDIQEYFATFGVFITEGYGLTETSPVLTVNDPDHIRPGTVGRPISGVEIRIAEDGEILARGPCIMKGYFKNPVATAEAIVDGWFHTGDVGVLDPDGCVRITDRKKDLIGTSGGKNVAPQLLEQAILSTGLASQVVVVGNGRRFISALLVPDGRALDQACRTTGTPAEPRVAALETPGVIRYFEEKVRSAMSRFAGYEQVKRIALLPAELSIESGDLTPTMKVRRRVVEEKHRARIEEIYRPSGGSRT